METKRAETAILISHNIDFKSNIVTKDKEDHYIVIMIKGLINQEAITIVNIYAPSIEAPKYIKQLLIKLKAKNR